MFSNFSALSFQTELCNYTVFVARLGVSVFPLTILLEDVACPVCAVAVGTGLVTLFLSNIFPNYLHLSNITLSKTLTLHDLHTKVVVHLLPWLQLFMQAKMTQVTFVYLTGCCHRGRVDANEKCSQWYLACPQCTCCTANQRCVNFTVTHCWNPNK